MVRFLHKVEVCSGAEPPGDGVFEFSARLPACPRRVLLSDPRRDPRLDFRLSGGFSVRGIGVEKRGPGGARGGRQPCSRQQEQHDTEYVPLRNALRHRYEPSLSFGGCQSPGGGRSKGNRLFRRRAGRRYIGARNIASPTIPSRSDPYQTSRMRVRAATAPKAMATWKRATASANL